MENFDTMTMSYLASPLSISTMQNGDYLGAMPLDMDAHQPPPPPPPPPPYDHETFVSGDDMSFPQQPMAPQPMRRYSNAQFDNPFPEMLPPFDAPPSEPPQQQQQQQQDASIDHNHKLLSFSMPIYNFTLLDYTLRRTSLSMSAQLHGMFFLAESPWTTSPTADSTVPPPHAELTCYRRNLFQITGSVTLPRTLRYIMTEQGDRIPILAQELTVSATESVEGNPVKIISVPWKTPAANATGQPEDKTEKEPPAIPLDTMAGQDMDSDYATFSIAWKRLQFRIATANNGRRKELQQHFIVRLRVVATLSTGAKISICEAQSGPVIVRGRSPRNFQSRKDLPLSGSAVASRKNTQTATLNRTATNDSTHQAAGSKRSKSPQDPASAPLPLQFDTDAKPQPQPHQQQQQSSSATVPERTPTSATRPTFTTATANGGVPAQAQPSPEMSRPQVKRRRTTANGGAVGLSLLDDGSSLPEHAVSSPDHTAANASTSPVAQFTNGQAHPQQQQQHQQNDADATKISRKSPSPSTRPPLASSYNIPDGNLSLFTQLSQHLSPSLASPHIMNPNETADLLYEYFPLGLDDWQAPVDAVYRPHVVHHTNIHDDPKAIAARSRSKTYFAGEAS